MSFRNLTFNKKNNNIIKIDHRNRHISSLEISKFQNHYIEYLKS